MATLFKKAVWLLGVMALEIIGMALLFIVYALTA